MTRFLPLLTLLACGPSIDNPSGDCQADGDGNRRDYFSSDQYLPDCQNPLERELWRVFAVSEERAYIVPRPDGMGLQFELCEDESLGALFSDHGLCDEFADPDVINQIAPADALAITNALHQRLRFSVSDEGRITPYAPEDDIIAACELTDDSAALDFCELLESRCTILGCDDIGYMPGPEAVAALVPALNLLYGVE